MRSSLAALIMLLLVNSASADQFEEASEWLERMSSAMRELDYQGTFVYLQGDDVETMRITHVRDGSGVRERLVAVSGPKREIMRDSTGVRSVVGEQQWHEGSNEEAGHVFPEFSAEALSEARRRYMFEIGQEGRIAGHKGRKINILPKDQYRYGYELWLQADTGLLLRWVLYDSQRKPLAKLMFTELKTGTQVNHDELGAHTPATPTVDSRQLQAAEPGFSPVAQVSAVRAQPSASLRPGALKSKGVPPGFRLAVYSQQDEEGGSQHLVLSDGLATVSVYIEPVDSDRNLAQGLSRMGTTNAWTNTGKAQRVTAIGEVPPITVRKIGTAFTGWRP